MRDTHTLLRIVLLAACLAGAGIGRAQPPGPAPAALPQFGQIEERCGAGVAPRGPDFAASGLILTAFSRDALWVVDLDRGSRYPLPETRPCGQTCRPSPDRRWLLYVSPETATYWMMRADGTGRTPAFPYYVSELDWWDAEHWLAWPTAGLPGIYPIGTPATEATPVRLNAFEVYSVQPGGYHGLRIAADEEGRPLLELTNLQDGESLALTEVRPGFGAADWSPDGTRLVYTGAGAHDESAGLNGAELFLVDLAGEPEPARLTDLAAAYGAVYIRGKNARHAVSWSLDGRYLAFWVLEATDLDLAADPGPATIHILDTQTGLTVLYCGLTASPGGLTLPELVWSPDGRYLAFGLDEAGDGRPPILYALDTVTGDFTEVTEGMYAANGTYDPVMWAAR